MVPDVFKEGILSSPADSVNLIWPTLIILLAHLPVNHFLTPAGAKS